QLLTHQREADELLVLVSVAHDDVVGSLAERQHGLELGLAADLETDSVRLTEVEDLLDDVALLVHLDRVNRGVASLVAELLDRALEALGQRLDPRPQDVGEPQQQGKRDSLRRQVLRQLEEIQPAFRLPGRVYGDVTLLVDPEITDTPALDVVKLEGIIYRPCLLRHRPLLRVVENRL